MEIVLNSLANRIMLIGICLVLVLGFLGASTAEYLAFHFSERNDSPSLRRAALLQPLNAEYRYRLGIQSFLLQPQAAIQNYRAAVILSPHHAQYWLALASAYQAIGNE